MRGKGGCKRDEAYYDELMPSIEYAGLNIVLVLFERFRASRVSKSWSPSKL